MKTSILAIGLLLFGVFYFNAPTAEIARADEPTDFSIVLVRENSRNMPAAIFSKADPELLKKYMPNGAAPSSISTYLLKTGDDTVLFDAGLGGQEWVEALEKAADEPAKIKTILLTHMHRDHIGGLLDGDKRRFPDAVILCSKPEYDYWLPKDTQARTPVLEKIRQLYGDDFKTFAFEEVVYSNGPVKIKALDAVGHTPGHTAFLVASPKRRFLVVGDLVHAAALQFPVPESCPDYDMDHPTAVETRKRILNLASVEKLPIAGMHIPTPGVGSVRSDGKGGYIFTPL